MISKEIRIINKLGLHARAAAKLVALASGFEAQIEISKDNRTVNGKSIMGVMMLAASNGSTIQVSTEGADEQQALQQIETLINNRFHESE